MFAAALIVFRESLEAALIIGVMAAATRGIPRRERWMGAGLIAGLLGAVAVASSMGAISNWADGAGQELFNAGVLMLAVCMLAWHNIWMSSHGREMAMNVKNMAKAIQDGNKAHSAIFLVVALAVLREGAETVLFLYGVATSSENGLRDTLAGGAAGIAAGALVGGLLYAGMLRIPLRWFFGAAGVLVLLLAASMASQVARLLVQADVLPSLATPLWDTSALLSDSSALGTLLHGLIGYDPQPSGMQMVFYGITLATIATGMWLVGRQGSTSPRTQSVGSL
ncbi:FTR1 family iron permease [Hydrogenophaga sp. MI9]|uniref:FTR1 family iron permease n=1 Tax=Hydrogenophaga sp. MI9 TaxID=3453719 RepID=UPI003EECE5C5